ncbi:MAG: group II intron reverse transcriptase/maturase [Gammaproteobacteria bacterium]|nr:group II intron reverse transcriptase/maturase [Gammaproteobacteria bacterium]
MATTKSFDISKQVVWQAYKQVKANRGAAGIDEQSMSDFDKNRSRNLYKIWNRLSSGSYFPLPVKRVEIPKKSGGKRYLGIPTIADRIAQTVVKLYLEPKWDSHFHPDSYGYRPNKSAHQAIAVTRKRCWQFDWVVEFDIKGAFDNIDHGLLLKAVRQHAPEPWMVLYIERWLTAPFETADGKLIARNKGTPQGGVISPLLMNLFMHYVFDHWMASTQPQCPFARYADDGVIHCRSLKQARWMLTAVANRLRECKLSIHPDKSKVVYCKDSKRQGHYENVQFTFLGFTFSPRCAEGKEGVLFTGFLPAVSDDAKKAMRSRIRQWKLHRRTGRQLSDIAKATNAVLLGWWNYYGSFYPSAMRDVYNYFDRKLMQWARRKYRNLKGGLLGSYRWLKRMAELQPGLFVSWRLFGIPTAR